MSVGELPFFGLSVIHIGALSVLCIYRSSWFALGRKRFEPGLLSGFFLVCVDKVFWAVLRSLMSYLRSSYFSTSQKRLGPELGSGL